MKETTRETIRRDLALWFGVLAPPLAWLTQFGLSYALAPWLCAPEHRWVIPALLLSAAAVALASGVVSWRLRGQQRWPRTEDEPARALTERARFMAGLGLCLSALFLLVSVAQWLASWFFPPCVE